MAQIVSVNRQPFVIPAHYTVARSEGFAAFGDAVLVHLTGEATQTLATIAASTAITSSSSSSPASPVGLQRKQQSFSHAAPKQETEQDEDSGSGEGGAGGPPPTKGVAVVTPAPRPGFLIRKYANVACNRRQLVLLARLLALHNEVLFPLASRHSATATTGTNHTTGAAPAVKQHSQSAGGGGGGAVLSMAPQSSTPAPSSQSILPVMEAFSSSTHKDDVYVVTPLSSSNLQDVLRSPTRLRTDQALLIAYRVAQGLHYLHSQLSGPIVYAALSPETIQLHPDLMALHSVRLADFTMAHALNEPLSTVSQWDAAAHGGIPVFHLCYRAPEWVLQLVHCIGPAADAWAFGCLLVALFTRAPLFVTLQNSIEDYAQQIGDLIGYPEDPSFMNHADAAAGRALWAACTDSRPPRGVSSLISASTDPLARQVFLLVKKLLHPDPRNRPTMAQVLDHPLFRQFSPNAAQVAESAAGGSPGSKYGSPLGSRSQAAAAAAAAAMNNAEHTKVSAFAEFEGKPPPSWAVGMHTPVEQVVKQLYSYVTIIR